MDISFPVINHPLQLIPYLLEAVPLQVDEYLLPEKENSEPFYALSITAARGSKTISV